MKKLSFSAAALCLSLLTLAGVQAQSLLSYSNAGTTYSQDFNSLTNAFTLSTTGATIFSFNNPSGINCHKPGWLVWRGFAKDSIYR